jgi:hypothetical protein
MSYYPSEDIEGVMPVVRRNAQGDIVEAFFQDDSRYDEYHKQEIERWRKQAILHGRFRNGEEPR